MMKKLILAILAIAPMVAASCGHKEQAQAPAVEPEAPQKTLVLYFSQTGATQQVAQELMRQLDADLVRIEPVEPYPLDYDSTIVRWKRELADSIQPEIKPLTVAWDDYSTVFLGFPIWGGTYALPIRTLLRQCDFAGKTVVTFATFGSGGLASATEDLRKALPQATVVKGYGVRNARLSHAQQEIRRFLIEGGYVEGQVDPLADYSEPQSVGEAERDIYTQATADYKFPLGEPLTVGSRNTPTGVDYRFETQGKGPDGKPMRATVYVTVPTEGTPEFTLVDRQ
jgi:flavodoxin